MELEPVPPEYEWRVSAHLRTANPSKSQRKNKAKHSASVDKDNGGIGNGNGVGAVAMFVAGVADGLLA